MSWTQDLVVDAATGSLSRFRVDPLITRTRTNGGRLSAIPLAFTHLFTGRRSDKLSLPPSALEALTKQDFVSPLTFELSTVDDGSGAPRRRVFAGLLDATAAEGHAKASDETLAALGAWHQRHAVAPCGISVNRTTKARHAPAPTRRACPSHPLL